MKQQLLKDFLKKHTVDDVRAKIKGELNEYCTDKAAYFFGNGELIISPADESRDEMVYVCDQIDFDYKLVEI